MKPQLNQILNIAEIKAKFSLFINVTVISACASLPKPVTVQHAMCEQFKPLSYSKLDTKETALAITQHNQLLEALCR